MFLTTKCQQNLTQCHVFNNKMSTFDDILKGCTLASVNNQRTQAGLIHVLLVDGRRKGRCQHPFGKPAACMRKEQHTVSSPDI